MCTDYCLRLWWVTAAWLQPGGGGGQTFGTLNIMLWWYQLVTSGHYVTKTVKCVPLAHLQALWNIEMVWVCFWFYCTQSHLMPADELLNQHSLNFIADPESAEQGAGWHVCQSVYSEGRDELHQTAALQRPHSEPSTGQNQRVRDSE